MSENKVSKEELLHIAKLADLKLKDCLLYTSDAADD